ALERTDDILQYVGDHKKEGQFLCGFAMETEQLLERADEKRRRKNLDMIVANSISQEGAGFQGDTNIVTLLTEDGQLPVGKMPKAQVASVILDEIVKRL
ncbi:MAG: phosphopantothenoylcysteine decarboxylase, partial [Clostridium sp.]|nr:phosphopantothenoylcysteine decarboxylase [Clostridium sp.]